MNYYDTIIDIKSYQYQITENERIIGFDMWCFS